MFNRVFFALVISTLPLHASYSVYFAGELFDHKHLAGNTLLAQAIEEQSKGEYMCNLPQDIEADSKLVFDRIAIRNKDLYWLITADFALFNFDGTDLDSGTVVEFMIAKMLDIPAVILRTDFRKFSEGEDSSNENWNLMVSGYPRTEIVSPDLLGLYRHHGLQKAVQLIALDVTNAFNRLLEKEPLIKDEQTLQAHYEMVINLCGSELKTLLNRDAVKKVITRKSEWMKSCFLPGN